MNPSAIAPDSKQTLSLRDQGMPVTFRRWWQTFWCDPVPGFSLAAFRILFGVYLLCYFLSFAPKVNLLFSSQGVYSPYLIPDLALPPLAASGLYVFTLLVIGGFLVGFRTRIIAPLLLSLYLYYYFLNLAVKNTAYDRLNVIFLCILCFGDLDRVWSVSSRKRSRRQSEANVAVWPIRLICLQLGFLYFGAGLWKLTNAYWHTGEMLYWTFLGSWGTPLAFGFVRLGLPSWFYDSLTWSVIIFELFMPFALSIPRIQGYAMIVGCIFHVGIATLLNIPEFMNCVTAYVLFVPPERVRALCVGKGLWVRTQQRTRTEC